MTTPDANDAETDFWGDEVDPDELPAALGAVLDADRGSLPFALLHGEALVAVAAWGLGESGVTPVDLGTEWAGLVESGEPVVLHDCLCPMTPAAFIADCLREAVRRDAVVVGVRPVTDTVKTAVPGGSGPSEIGDGPDRDDLLVITSPVVLPAAVVAALDVLPSDDVATLVAALAERFPVVTRLAPPEGRRVASLEDVTVLEALTAP
ncbi:2-C-methyl-D-erythritol 4-phosphate cytidylyltransferase [Nocardioides dokdonensis]|uniref:2-C-methyl-D-erythritol 4-phosphate cytidylyltransferase n=1 Tax=Nocardioides dokdonensis TaxID=450734 RepID=UPI000A8DB7F6|nr:2-C-methyl-D-erythritol 4-phosphate cytidylyltransferase [Nocardioides dokdonensis]